MKKSSAKSAYVPEAGDIVWLNFDPQLGSEHKGNRPALVLSPYRYNNKTGLMVCCLMTTHIKNYPFEVVLTKTPISVVLADQVKSLDWRARLAKKKGEVSAVKLAEVRKMISLLIGG